MPTAPPFHRPFAREVKPAPRKDDAGAKLTRKVHNSARWRYKVQPAQLRANPLCCMCEAEGRVEAACHVDHIVPIRDGGAPFDAANLRSLCVSHHSAVTREWQNNRGAESPSTSPPSATYVVA